MLLLLLLTAVCSEWDFLKRAIVDTKELATVEVRLDMGSKFGMCQHPASVLGTLFLPA